MESVSSMVQGEYEKRICKEQSIYRNQVNVHELPAIFHYWSNKYLLPMMLEYGFRSSEQLTVHWLRESAARCRSSSPVFLSIGAGNCDREIRAARALKALGLDQFCIECLEINPDMLARARELARREGLDAQMAFVEGDFNRWTADKRYAGVMAHEALHHVVNLESLFDEVHRSMEDQACFVIHDTIGRNGHQRWPEALAAVHRFWAELPQEYRYNCRLNRHEPLYENWNAARESFEGIRAQDILPLLVERFHFHVFVAYANVVDVFIDRCFGHNFRADAPWDRDFIDRVHAFDEQAICAGEITPAHMIAVVSKAPAAKPLFSRGLSPKFCVRRPDPPA